MIFIDALFITLGHLLFLSGNHNNYMGNIVHLKMDFNKIIICLKGKVKNEI